MANELIQHINLKEHLFLNTHQIIEDSLKDLKEKFSIYSLVYLKRFADGSEIRLSNKPDWIEYFYEKKLYQLSIFENGENQFDEGFLLWQTLKDKHFPVLNNARKHQIDHGLTYCIPDKNFTEYFFFGSKVDKPETLNQMINHLPLLKSFGEFEFKLKAENLLSDAEKNRILVSPSKINDQAENKCLTNRELEISQKLILGFSAKEIAVKLYLSPRTVETHIAHIKQKLNCTKRSELIKKLFQLM